jgi:hypothetical protein
MLYWKLQPQDFSTLSPGQRTFSYEQVFKVPKELPTGPAKVEFGLGYEGMPPLRGESKRFDVLVE